MTALSPLAGSRLRSSRAMSHEEQARLAVAVANGDREAAEALLRANEGFVRNAAWQMSANARREVPEEIAEDCMQAGRTALLHAATLFDPKRGVSFLTFAAWHVRARIGKLLMDQGSDVRVPINQQAEQKLRLHAVHVDAAPRGAEDGEGTVGDYVLVNPETPEDLLDNAEQSARTTNLLEEYVRGLSPRHRYSWVRYMLSGWTLKRIGEDLGVSRERVRQLLKQAAAHVLRRAGSDVNVDEFMAAWRSHGENEEDLDVPPATEEIHRRCVSPNCKTSLAGAPGRVQRCQEHRYMEMGA